MELDATYKATLMSLQIATVCGYLLGSIPFGLVLTRMAGLGDIRKIGSGNIGATNVLRTGNKFLAFLTLVGDVGKGAAAALLFTHFVNAEAGILLVVPRLSGTCSPYGCVSRAARVLPPPLGPLLRSTGSWGLSRQRRGLSWR
jgi:glycerol-3-phosphate acyltransferase PlsY